LLTSRGPHGYEHSFHDLSKLKEADLLIYNGLTLDDEFVDKMLRVNKNKTLVTLSVGEEIKKADEKAKPADKLLRKGDGDAHDHKHDHKDGKHEHAHDHKHGPHDPHLWLGPKQARAMTEIIADKLAALDPPNAAKYKKRAAAFVKEIDDLEAHAKAKFDDKHVHMVTMHESFGYFAEAYGLEIVGSIQRIPGLDPDLATRQRLVELCKKENVSVIAVEPQYSQAQAESLQTTLKKAGVDVAIVVLDPLETCDVERGKTNPDPGFYLKKLRENIDTLAKALK
jgi:ABC-type Zn uptake system ZnuABC Zn-binding protein ZnuA